MNKSLIHTLIGITAIAGISVVKAQTFTGTIRTSNTAEPNSGRTQRIFMNEADGTVAGNRAPIGTQLWIVIDSDRDGKIAGLFSDAQGTIGLGDFTQAFNSGNSGFDTLFNFDSALMRVDGKAPGNQTGIFEQDVTGLSVAAKSDLWVVGWNPAGGLFNTAIGDGVGPTSINDVQVGDKFALYKLSNPTIPQIGNAFLPISQNLFLGDMTVVPEPGTYAVVAGAGMMAFALIRRAARGKK